MSDNYMKIRVNSEEKAKIKAFCKKKGISVSAMLRLLIFQAMEEKNKNGKIN